MHKTVNNDSYFENAESEVCEVSWSGALLFFARQIIWFSLGALTCKFLWAEISLHYGSPLRWIQDVMCFMVSLLAALCLLYDAGKCSSQKLPTAFQVREGSSAHAPLWRFVAFSLGLLFVSCLAIAYAPLMLYAICPSVISRNQWVPFVVVYLVWTSFFLMTMIGACKRFFNRSGKPMPIGLTLLGLIARLAFVFCICELAKIPMLIALTDRSLSIGCSVFVIPIWVSMQIVTVVALILTARCR